MLYATGTADFTEVLYESFIIYETGNTIAGNYDRDETDGVRWSTLDATTTIGTDVYTVTQSVDGTFTRHAEGNRLTGDFLNTDTASDNYEVIQVGVGTKNFTLTMTGTNAYSDEHEGNAFTGHANTSSITSPPLTVASSLRLLWRYVRRC